MASGVDLSSAMTPSETTKTLHRLTNPKKIQDFLNGFTKKSASEECIVRSPKVVLESGTANCMEGALLACAALLLDGEQALLLDLKVGVRNHNDVDHVVALFKRNGCYGAISRTSHAVLRYREPVYATVRELALSYFHEYFTDDGRKTLRSFSDPFDVVKAFGTEWIESDDDLYLMAVALDDSPHHDILTPDMMRNLRPADDIEIRAGKIVEG